MTKILLPGVLLLSLVGCTALTPQQTQSAALELQHFEKCEQFNYLSVDQAAYGRSVLRSVLAQRGYDPNTLNTAYQRYKVSSPAVSPSRCKELYMTYAKHAADQRAYLQSMQNSPDYYQRTYPAQTFCNNIGGMTLCNHQ